MTVEDNMIIPNGVGFRFIVKPSLSENHQKGLRYMVCKNSGLDQYFGDVWVYYYDGCGIHEESIFSDDKLRGKQMVVKIICGKPIVAIPKDKEGYFYEQIKSKGSKCIINMIQSNPETKYEAELGAFVFEISLLGALRAANAKKSRT